MIKTQEDFIGDIAITLDKVMPEILIQLTRIADQGGLKETESCAADHYCICGRLQPNKPTPPDALVEVCQEILEAQKGAPIEPCDDKHDKALIIVTMDYDLMPRLKDALDDHEKAVT